jgi:hypothetical protein
MRFSAMRWSASSTESPGAMAWTVLSLLDLRMSATAVIRDLDKKWWANAKEFQRILPCAQHRHGKGPVVRQLAPPQCPIAPQKLF